MEPIDLTNEFLVAMPGLLDPNFHQTVIYIFSHNKHGAMGIVINRPLDMDLGEIFEQMQLTSNISGTEKIQVFDGGPVKTDRGFIIHKPDARWQSSIKVSDNIEVTTSKDILEAISNGTGPAKNFIALGYAGWGAGEIERELMDNCWLNTPVNTNIIFDTPAEMRWEYAASSLGINMNNLSSQIGHA